MADPYERDRSQDEYSKADYKRLRMTSGPLGTGSSPQRERESSDRNLEQSTEQCCLSIRTKGIKILFSSK